MSRGATGTLYLGTDADFTTQAGFGGDSDDLIACTPTSLGDNTACSMLFYWNGGEHGLAGKDIDGVSFAGTFLPAQTVPPAPAMTTAAAINVVSAGGAGSGLSFDTNDILTYVPSTNTWAMLFDGSDVGISANLDAFYHEPDGAFLLSLTFDGTVPGLGTVDDADVIRFTPTSLGANTAGSWAMYLDGSDVGLDTYGEGIDAVGRAPDGRLLVSSLGNFAAQGVTGANEDLFAFTATSLGDNTAGTWALYFDGSDVGLGTGTDEDIDGLWVDPTTGFLYLSNLGDFAAGVGFGGDKNDLFVCAPTALGETTSCNLGLFWDAGSHGLSSGNVRGIELVPPVGGAAINDGQEARQQSTRLYLPLVGLESEK